MSTVQVLASAVSAKVALTFEPPIDAALLMHRHVVHNAAARGALCSDGTPAVFYVRRCNSSYYHVSAPFVTSLSLATPSSSHTPPHTFQDESCNNILQKWIVAFEAGAGLCYDAKSCAQRATSAPSRVGTGAKSAWSKATLGNIDGLLLPSPEANPNYYKATGVFVPSCSSDEWAGNSSVTVQREGGGAGKALHFRGRAIARAVLEDLATLPAFSANHSRTLPLADELILLAPAAIAAQFPDLVQSSVPLAVRKKTRMICDGCNALDIPPLVSVAKQPCTGEADCPPLVTLRSAFAYWSGAGRGGGGGGRGGAAATRAVAMSPPAPFAGCAAAASGDPASCLMLPALLSNLDAMTRRRMLVQTPLFSSRLLRQLRSWPVVNTSSSSSSASKAFALAVSGC